MELEQSGMNFKESIMVVETQRGAEPRAVVLKELEVRVALPEELERVGQLLEVEHYLGHGRDVAVGVSQQILNR